MKCPPLLSYLALWPLLTPVLMGAGIGLVTGQLLTPHHAEGYEVQVSPEDRRGACTTAHASHGLAAGRRQLSIRARRPAPQRVKDTQASGHWLAAGLSPRQSEGPRKILDAPIPRTYMLRYDYSWPLLIAGTLLGLLSSLLLYAWSRGPAGLRSRLNTALRRRDIHMVYQPLVALDSRRVVGAEALARWPHRTLGPIPPDRFFQWAETAGIGRQLTRYVARAALTGARERLREDTGFYLSINVSPRDIEDPSFLGDLLGLLGELAIAPGRIALEITESSTFRDSDPRPLIKPYRDAGFRIFIDDFGAGYANLNNLLHWEIDGIKLDRALVQSVNTDYKGETVLDSVLEMTRKLNVPVLIEGIETEDQARYVLQRAPDATGQGWLFGRPGSISQVPAAMRRASG